MGLILTKVLKQKYIHFCQGNALMDQKFKVHGQKLLIGRYHKVKKKALFSYLILSEQSIWEVSPLTLTHLIVCQLRMWYKIESLRELMPFLNSLNQQTHLPQSTAYWVNIVPSLGLILANMHVNIYATAQSILELLI